MISEWPTGDEGCINDDIEAQMTAIMETIKTVRNLRAEVGAAPGKKSEVILNFTDEALRPVFESHKGYLVALAAAEPVTLLAAGAEKFRKILYEILVEKVHPRGILERCDADVRLKEGLPQRKEIVYGDVPKTPVEMLENGIRFDVDVWNGHKTGYYLDQRDARFEVGKFARGKHVLNCFSYTGGFGLFALQNDAKLVTEVDVSRDALQIADSLIQKNGFDKSKTELVEADVFAYLRKCRDSRKTFDLIVLDPPKFIESKSHLEKGARGYKDINLLALKLLAPQGMLATFSCSGLMEMSLFQKIVADAALDAHRDVQIIKRFGQPADHPIKTTFPEGQYLKGLLLQAD